MNSALKSKEVRKGQLQTDPPQRPGRFGPATWIALLAGAIVLVTQVLHGPGDPAANAGRIVYESDGHGKMKPISASSLASGSAMPTAVHPLWKPEVGTLLESDLALSATQRKEIGSLAIAWRSEKTSMERALQDATAETSNLVDRRRQEHAVSINLLKQGLGDYSALSRQYDARRTDFWNRGISLLSRGQRTRVEQISKQNPIAHSGSAL